MNQITRTPTRRNSASAVPFRSIGTVPLGDRSQLAVQVGISGGARVINMRNEMTQGGAMLPAGPGALVGLDRVPDLIALLQQARAHA